MVTRHKYNKRGQCVRSVTITEAEWDEQERGWMLALAAWRAKRCGGCGGNLDVTTDPENYERYSILPPLQCHQCVALARSAKPYLGALDNGQPKHEAPHALLHMVELRRTG